MGKVVLFHFVSVLSLTVQFYWNDALTFSHANEVSTDICSTCAIVSYLGFETPTQTSSMSDDDCRNTLIVELAKLTSDSTTSLQQLSNADLTGYSYGSNALWYYNVRTKTELSGMSLADQKNTLIQQLTIDYPYALKNVSENQSFNTLQLVNNLLSYEFTKTEQVADIGTLQSLFGDLVHINTSQIKFGLHDNTGKSMDALHIIQSQDKTLSPHLYYGAHHTLDTNANQFNLHLASSSDLITWTHVRTLLLDADMPYLYQIDGTDYILMVHEQWMNPQSSAPSRISFKLYANEQAFVNGIFEHSYNASLTLGCKTSLEGTPSVYSAVQSVNGCGIDAYIGFHYNDIDNQLDQNGLGILNNFGCNDDSTSWSTYNEKTYNQQLNDDYHVIGNIGQRDVFRYNNNNYVIQEGNIAPRPPTVWQDWRLWIWNAKNDNYNEMHTKLLGNVYLMNIMTPKGSFAFANPSVKTVDCPTNSEYNGQQCIFVSYFIFGEGAGPGEGGSLAFYKLLPK